jgi:5-methylcytosine-specific restriction protein A
LADCGGWDDGVEAGDAGFGGDVPQAAWSSAHAARTARRRSVAGILDRQSTMATYLFAWNPALWSWPELASDIRKLRRRGHVDIEWSGGRTRTIEVGSRAFLVRVGVEPRGIFGAGYTLTAPQEREHWRPDKAAQGATTQYLKLRLDTLLALPAVLYADLAKPPFARFRWGVRQSGTSVPTALADALEELWEARVERTPSR